MQTVFHLKSVEDLNSDLIEKIKKRFKDKPIVITVDDENDGFKLSQEQLKILDKRRETPIEECIVAEESLKLLRKKHGL